MGKRLWTAFVLVVLLLALAPSAPAQAAKAAERAAYDNLMIKIKGSQVDARFEQQDAARCMNTYLVVWTGDQAIRDSAADDQDFRFAEVWFEQYDPCRNVQVVQFNSWQTNDDVNLTIDSALKSAHLSLDFTTYSYGEISKEIHVVMDLGWEGYGKMKNEVHHEHIQDDGTCSNILLDTHGLTRQANASGQVWIDGQSTYLQPTAGATMMKESKGSLYLQCDFGASSE